MYINNFSSYINEQQQILNEDIKTLLLKRIPFLKEYNIFKNKDKNILEAQRVVYNQNVKTLYDNNTIVFPQFNISSDIIYSYNNIHDKTFHNFIIKNELHFTQPKEMNDLTFRVLIYLINNLQKQLSYHKEIIVEKDSLINKNDFDKIINEMNGNLFKIEEFTNKHNINLF